MNYEQRYSMTTTNYTFPLESIPDSEYTPDAYDKFISAKVMIPIGDSKMKGVVKRRVKDKYGLLVGQQNNNPMLVI